MIIFFFWNKDSEVFVLLWVLWKYNDNVLICFSYIFLKCEAKEKQERTLKGRKVIHMVEMGSGARFLTAFCKATVGFFMLTNVQEKKLQNSRKMRIL